MTNPIDVPGDPDVERVRAWLADWPDVRTALERLALGERDLLTMIAAMGEKLGQGKDLELLLEILEEKAKIARLRGRLSA